MFRAILVKGFSGQVSVNLSKTLKAKLDLPLTSNGSPSLHQTACISSKAMRDRSYKKPEPFPYKEKPYTSWHHRWFLDDTLSRFDENTQLIVVDGNIAAGKSDFAKNLADELEMLYLPEVNVDSYYIDKHGFDLRSLDHLMPASFKSLDVKGFYENPHHPNVPKFQGLMLVLRLEQYMEALAHILNTGQGVVLERCAYSDFVFVDAMHKAGYINSGVKSYIYDMADNGLFTVPLRPTLIIYLDASVDTCLERIRKRNIDYEAKSKVLTKDYLETIELSYKLKYLKDMKKHCEVVVYDWNEFGDIDTVVHDLERLDFTNYEKFEVRHRAWRIKDRLIWAERRFYCTRKRQDVLEDALHRRVDVPEMLYSGEDWLEAEELLEKAANIKYQKGFNPFLGDKWTSWIFKGKDDNYWDKQKFQFTSIFRTC